MRITIYFVSTVYMFINCSAANAQTAYISKWKDSASGAIYNTATKTVAFSKADKKGIFHIYLSDSSGNNQRSLTYSSWQNDRHQWAEEWSPDGAYLFCYIERNDYAKEKGHKRKPVDAIPGYGAYMDIWAIKRDGSQAWQLTTLDNNFNSALLHGAISADGKLFAWTQRIEAPRMLNMNLGTGTNVFKVAEIKYSPQPLFINIRTVQPGSIAAGGELESISAKDSSLLFYSTFESKNIFATPLYRMNFYTNKISKLTTDSYAQCPSYTPDQQHIIYMTGKDCDIFPFQTQGADWWIMNTDGSNKRRLTYMNVKNHPQSVNKRRLAGSLSFTSNTTFIGDVLTQTFGLAGNVVQVDFSEFVK